MTPQLKARQLYNKCFELFPTPTDIEKLAQVNKQVNSINIATCEIMKDLEPNRRYLWAKTKELIEKTNK